jgi:hypothetical protein
MPDPHLRFTTIYEALPLLRAEGGVVGGGPANATDPTLARQQAVALMLPSSVALIGVGGVGSWIGYFLALAGVPKLYLFDGDRVSESNLNRLPYGPAALGALKTEALKKWIGAVRPQCEVECFPNFSAKFATGLALGPDWVVVSTDTWASRKEAHSWTRDNAGNYVEAAAEGEVGSIAGSPADWATPDEEHPGYASVPVWVGPCVSAAMMATAQVLHDAHPSRELVMRMGWDENLGRANYVVCDR